MYKPVVSIPYEIARHITKQLLAKGLLTEAEFQRIDKEHQKTFILDH